MPDDAVAPILNDVRPMVQIDPMPTGCTEPMPPPMDKRADAARESAIRSLLVAESAGGARSAGVKETHTAFVFLIGDAAYKLKKPARLPYLDFTTPDRRRLALQEELRINRALAAPVYKGLRQISRGTDGTLSLDGPGMPIDWLLQMVRLPQEAFMDWRLARGTIRADHVRALAAMLCRFYDEAERRRGGADIYLRHLHQESLINREHLLSMRTHLSAHLLPSNLQLASSLIDRHAPEIADRGKAGLIVDGHGDLRPEHICLTDPPVIVDRLEFDETMRQIDIYDEVNYLALETELSGHRWIGAELRAMIDAHFQAHPSPLLLKGYGLFRLFLRARLAIDHLLEPFPTHPERWVKQARLFLAKANDLSESVC